MTVDRTEASNGPEPQVVSSRAIHSKRDPARAVGAFSAVLRAGRATSRTFAWIGGGAILLSAFPVCIDVATRALFNSAWLYSYEMSSYLFAVAVAFSYAHAVFTGAHVRIEFLRGRLPEKGYWVLDVLAHFGLASVAVVLARSAWSTFAESLALGARSVSTLGFPMMIPQGLWALGLSWFALVTVLMLAALLLNALRGRLVTVERILAEV